MNNSKLHVSRRGGYYIAAKMFISILWQISWQPFPDHFIRSVTTGIFLVLGIVKNLVSFEYSAILIAM